MPKNKRQSPTKHVHQKESKSSGKDTIFQSVQEMFEGRFEAEIIHMVLEECNWNVEEAVDNLFAMCETGMQPDPESKNRLAQIAHDVLCSDASSDSMSVSSHSSMASSEETSSSRSGMAKSSTNSSRENILNSTEIEGAIGFDPSMIEVESLDKSMPDEDKNMEVLQQYCTDAEAWVSSMDKLGMTVREKGYKNMSHTTGDVLPLQTTGANLVTPQIQEADVSSPQLVMQECIPDVDYSKYQHNSSVNVNSKLYADLDYPCEDLSASRLRHSDSAVVDMVECLPGENRTTCELNKENFLNSHSGSGKLTHDSGNCPKDTLPRISDHSTPVSSTDIIQGNQVTATEMEQKDVLVFSAATSNTLCMPFNFADQNLFSPEKREYAGSGNLGVFGKSAPSLCNDDSAVMEPDSPLSPVSVFENLGKLAGEIAHMELHSQLETHTNSDIFNSDDYGKDFFTGLKSNLQNSDALANMNVNTDVHNDNKLCFKDLMKLENESGSIDGGNTESFDSKNKLDLQTFGQEFCSTGSRTSSNEPANCSSNKELDQYADKPTMKETSNCEYNATYNLKPALEKDMDDVSPDQIYDSDVNISGSSSDSLNESLTRALNDSINLTELSVIDDDYVVRSQSCMSSQSEEEVGEELTTALNKSVDETSPGEKSDVETNQATLTKTPKMVLRLHDSDSDEKLSEFCEQSKKDMQADSMPVGGGDSQTSTRPEGIEVPDLASNLSVNACEFVPNVRKEASSSSSFNMNMNSDPCKPAPTFLTPKYVSPTKTNFRTTSSSDCNLRFPFSSVTQQTPLATSLLGTAWVTPIRQHSSPATGNDQIPYSKVEHPPPKIPQYPPPHWLPATPVAKFGDPVNVVTKKKGPPTKLTDIEEVEAKIKAGHKCFVMLRGLPGSGKSTLARKLQHTTSKPGVVLSSDDYFIQNGIYRFEPHLLSEAHEWNRLRTIQNLHNGCTPVVVDNTNTQVWEMKPYIKQAQKFGYDISFLEPDTQWKFQPKELARRNTHGVPLSKIRMMLERYEKGLTVEQVLGKPQTPNGQHKNDQKTLPRHAKDKTVHTQRTYVKAQPGGIQAHTGSSDMKAQPVWRQAHTSLVQQYANNLGQAQKQHARQPSVSTNALNTPTKRDETVTEESCSENHQVPTLSVVPSPVSGVVVCSQTQQSTTPTPLTSGNVNNSNISKENWQMWKKLGLSDLVKQFSKKTEQVSSIAEETSMDLSRCLPMDNQMGENQSPCENTEQQREFLTTVSETDKVVNSPREDETQETVPVASKTEDAKKSRSPGSHKGCVDGNTKDMSPRSQSSHLRDSSPSSDSTFHTCSEMLTDQEGSSSSLQEDQAVNSQDTSLDLSNTSSRNDDEGSDCVTDSHNTGVVDQGSHCVTDSHNTGVVDQGSDCVTDSHNTGVVDQSPVDKASEPEYKQDTELTSNNKPDSPESNAPESDFDSQKTPEDDCDTQKILENNCHTQKSYVEDPDVSENNTHIALKIGPDTHQTSADDLDTHQKSADDLDTHQTSADDLDTNQTSADDLYTHQTSADDLDTNQRSADDLDTNQKSANDLDTNQTSADDLDTHQTSADDLDTNQKSANDLDTNKTTADDKHQTSESLPVTVAEALDKTQDMLLAEYSSQCDAELPDLGASREMLTDDITQAENIPLDCTSVIQSQGVKPCSTTPEEQNVSKLEDDRSVKVEEASDDVNGSSKDIAVFVQQTVKYSLDDIPKNVKDTVDELIRENVGSELNYSVDYSVTANELKAILLFTDLNDEEKMIAEQYISQRLCSKTSELCALTSAQKQSDDGISQPPAFVQDELSEQIQVYDDFNRAQNLEWEEPKPVRKQRFTKRPKLKCKQGLSEVKTDIDKSTKESCKVSVEVELENQKVLKTASTMGQEDINIRTHPQQQREKRTRNYRTHASSPPVDDKDQGISTEKSRAEPLVTSVAAQALCKEVEDGDGQSSQSQSNSSQESSPTKPAKKKSNRRKLDPYKQGPFLEPEVKNKVIGADWSFPVLPETAFKEEVPKKKRVQCLLEHETHITAGDLKVLNAVNRGEDPAHLMGGRARYKILASHNKDIHREVTDSDLSSEASSMMDKSVVPQHCVDRGTMTEENIEVDIEFLQSSFPAIPVDELSDVLHQCGNNLQWAIDLLLDWKYNLPLSSDDKDKFISRMCQLQKSPTLPKFSFSARPNSISRSPSSLLDMCVGCVESQHIAPRQDIEHQIIMSSQQRLNSIEEKIRLKQTYSRTLSQSISRDEEFNETILKQLTSMTEQAVADGTSDADDDKGVPQNQLDTSYVESWTVNQANDFTRGPSVDSSISGHRSDEEALDYQTLQSSASVMSLQLTREKIQALESQFGKVPHLTGVTGDVVVSLDYRTAQALHQCLMLTARQQTMDRQKQLREDEAFARRLQDEEILTTTSQPPPTFQRPPVSRSLPLGGAPQHRPHPTEQGVTSLKDIMVEEMERERKKEEEQKLLEASGNHNVLANRLKRKKLYEQFPGIDESLLDDIYRDNSYNLDNTILAIRGFLTHDTAPPKTVRTAEASLAYEEKLFAAAKQQSLQEMMDSYLYSPEKTKAYQEHEDPDYDDFRAEANIHHRLRHECFLKAQEAYRRGMRDVASFYSRQGHGHSQKIKEANQRAAEKILQSRNILKERSAVDLHGLHVDEAIEALERIIPEREEDLMAYPDKRKQHLVIITGRGSHSKGGIARIRPAVLRFLVTNGYKFSEIYKGCFKVLLKYRSHTGYDL
ncbi:uncharacterized protein LOC110441305 isoform X2 [Mizuhopecten yessoensis]|uniref:uncharacterized protein LOC110441305 isoform X2 n=1 Tax=Mizuhopecten yessoensis TaxID=6573 RepID=UPI000B45BD98|nr:uncharacterized protein LOC110441305 isoform X2 [Mizuhopecten yessoensis]